VTEPKTAKVCAHWNRVRHAQVLEVGHVPINDRSWNSMLQLFLAFQKPGPNGLLFLVWRKLKAVVNGQFKRLCQEWNFDLANPTIAKLERAKNRIVDFRSKVPLSSKYGLNQKLIDGNFLASRKGVVCGQEHCGTLLKGCGKMNGIRRLESVTSA
jgi:hypothetical protein